MPLPLFFTAAQTLTADREVLGTQATEYREWMKRGLPLPEFLVIPRSTLQEARTGNSLTRASAHELMRAYHRHLASDFVFIQPWSNIIGDANVLESVLAAYRRAPHQAVVIRHQPQPGISGFALTRHPDARLRNRVLLYATWGVTDPAQEHFDTLEFDLSSGEIVKTQVAHKPTYLCREPDKLVRKSVARSAQRRLCLPESSARTMAQLFYSVKQQVPYHTLVRWYIKNRRLFVEEWTRQRSADEWDELTTALPLVRSHPLTGASAINGRVVGKARLITTHRPPRRLQTGEIIVCSQLNSELAPLLKQCAGVVCEASTVSPLLLQILHKYGIPTAVRVSQATRHIQPGASLELNCQGPQAAWIYQRTEA